MEVCLWNWAMWALLEDRTEKVEENTWVSVGRQNWYSEGIRPVGHPVPSPQL